VTDSDTFYGSTSEGVADLHVNYMGWWDNASTIAPRRRAHNGTIPCAMLWSVFIIAMSTCAVAAVWITGLPARAWENRLLGDIAAMGESILRVGPGGWRQDQALLNVNGDRWMSYSFFAVGDWLLFRHSRPVCTSHICIITTKA